MAWRKTSTARGRARVMTAEVTEPRVAAHRKLTRRERRALAKSQRESLTAAAMVIRPDRGVTIQSKRWQDEAWDNWRSQGELWYATEWKGNAISRVRLKAAKIVPGSDEPEIVEDGPAAELMDRLAQGVGGQSVLMKSFSVKLDIAGDSYFIMYEDDDGTTHSGVYSTDVVRKDNSGNFSVRVDESAWVPLPAESLVVRIWNPDEQFPWLAISPTEPALGVLREIDLYNRKIITELTARVASNGVWLVPEEVTFPVRDEFSDAADPLISEFIDVASKAIQNPGSAAAALPIPMRVASEFIDKFKHIRFSDNVVQETLDGRDRALGRLAKMLNVPAEVLTGMGDVNHWCVPDDTQILTHDRGWVSESELHVGDVVYTLNVNTRLAEWQPVRDVARFDVDNIEMVKIAGRFHDSLSTPTHRWLIERDGQLTWTTSSELHHDDRIIRSMPTAVTSTVAKYDDAFVELLAWYVTDGTLTRTRAGSPAQARIGQSHRVNSANVDRIRAALVMWCGAAGDMNGALPTWREETHVSSGMTIFVLNRHARNAIIAEMTEPFRKILNLDVVHAFTHAQLELFISTFIAGDGGERNGSRQTAQRDVDRLAAVELAAIIAGYPVTTGARWSAGYKPGELTTLRIGKQPVDAKHRYDRPRVGDTDTEWYSGRIWCPVTDNTTWLAKRNGQVFFTGNSAWQIEEGAIKIHVLPTVETICRGLTVGYLQPGLSSQSLSEYAGDTDTDDDGEEDDVQYVVWYDASELEKKPDLGEKAIQLHDRVTISDAALRRATGFDDSDAPTESERNEQILTKLAYNGQQAVNSFEMLTGTPVAGGGGEESTTPPGANLPAPEPATGAAPIGPPSTSTTSPPVPSPDTSAVDSRFLEIVERTRP